MQTGPLPTPYVSVMPIKPTPDVTFLQSGQTLQEDKGIEYLPQPR